ESAGSSSGGSSGPLTGGLFMGSNSASSAFQTSTPSEPAAAPAPPTETAAPAKAEPAKEAKKEERKKTAEGLVADTSKAQYAEQGGRREPVTVRPLNENAPTAEASAPPRPAAAPVEQVARLEGGLEPAQAAASASAPANAAPPSAAALVDRLSEPAPSPAAGNIPDSPRQAAPLSPTAPVASAQIAAVPASSYTPTYTPPVQPLIPAASSIAGYGSDTIVVDSSGTRGGGMQLAAVPRAGFDPGNASVSSEVGTVSFAPGSSAISAQGKAVLADVARLRAQVDGAIRVVGRGDQAAARAAAVSRELKRLGVPSARLYDGGADSTMLGDAADLYLDY
ncbi:MAG: hypothetical protein JNK21_13900, partial [Rhodospirillaceae bacterium]|nr:hypothetical protein [Rhodospirillaceae bacterium]